MYNPNPLNTENIELPQNLTELTEVISANIHDVWARQRMDEGWQWGESRDDRQKTSPCLVPYEKLPEGEKEYDRSTVLQTLKMIIAMGYSIEKKPDKAIAE